MMLYNKHTASAFISDIVIYNLWTITVFLIEPDESGKDNCMQENFAELSGFYKITSEEESIEMYFIRGLYIMEIHCCSLYNTLMHSR